MLLRLRGLVSSLASCIEVCVASSLCLSRQYPRQKRLGKRSSPVSMKIDLYDTDFYAWTQEQAALLWDQQAQALDYANLAEEVESLGKSQQQAVESHLEVVLTHFRAWCYVSTRPDARRGWRLVIREQRRRLARLLHHNPSLRPTVPAVVLESYPHARLMALEATEASRVPCPETCRCPQEQVLEAEFWPEGEKPPVRRMGFNT